MVASIIVILLVLIMSVLVFYMNRTAKDVHIQQEELNLTNWPKGFDGVTFLFVSDIHKNLITQEIRDRLQKSQIDLVFLGGDIIERGVSLTQVREHVRFFCSLAPTYFVWGNHDYDVDPRALDTLLREEGVQVLDNRATAFEAGEDRFWLIGVDDISRAKDQLSYALMDIDAPGYRFLLAHDPMIIQKIESQHQISMVWSGHTHGGQIRLPVLSKKILGPFYHKYVSGFYAFPEKGTTLFISQGIGTSHFPFRFGTQAEIHLFTLRSAEDENR